MKILWWDRDGLAIFYKRIERGTFQYPTDEAVRKTKSPPGISPRQEMSPRCEIRTDELALLLEGIDLASVKRRRRYERLAAGEANAAAATA